MQWPRHALRRCAPQAIGRKRSVMDFTFNDNHKMVARTVYDFARKTVMPAIREHDRAHTFPHELLPQMAALGFMGMGLSLIHI